MFGVRESFPINKLVKLPITVCNSLHVVDRLSTLFYGSITVDFGL